LVSNYYYFFRKINFFGSAFSILFKAQHISSQVFLISLDDHQWDKIKKKEEYSSCTNPSKRKWIEMDRNEFVRVKFRFWIFEFISIQLKFPNFLKSILIHTKE